MYTHFDNLVDAFKTAKAAGVAAGENKDDGGTCNLDSPAFKLPRVPAAVVERAAVAAGCTASEFKWFGGQRWFWLGGFLAGQANLRARMSGAATQALKDAASAVPGMTVCEYCQCD